MRAYSINGERYTPITEFKKTSQSSAEYTVTVAGVDLGDGEATDISFTFEYTVSQGEFKKRMTSLSGDKEGLPLTIKDINPYLTVDSYMNDPSVAVSNGSGDEILGELSALSDNTVYDSSFAFVSNSGLSAAIYTPSSYSNPYIAAVRVGDYSRAQITSAGYVHRLSDGTRVQAQTDDGLTDVLYESILGFAADTNKSGEVDWQDAALWLRDEIPQMSTELREYLETGDWGQFILAFPTGISAADFNADEYNAATYVYSTYAQALEVLRRHYNMTDGVGQRSFAMVGWQGRGHDYGWPDLAEQPFNPALTDLSGVNNAGWAAFKLKSDTGGSAVIGFNESGGALYWWSEGTEHTVYFIDENGAQASMSTSKSQGMISGIPSGFDGYVAFPLDDLDCHSGYKTHDTDGILTLDELKSLQIWNCDAGWEASSLMLADDLAAITESIRTGKDTDGIYRISETDDRTATVSNGNAYLNVKYADSLTVDYYRELYAALGGDLSFHINQSDVTENSSLYINGAESVTEDLSYTGDFGWKAYNISHFKDYTSGAFARRVDAFVEKYYAPFIIYSDVYTDRAAFDYGTEEDRYAKAQEVDYWLSRGTNVATEYYSQEKYLNGQFLFINMICPSVIDCFMISGNARISVFGASGDTYSEKALWGISTDYLTAAEKNKISHTYGAAQYNAQIASGYAFNTCRGAFVNGMLGSAGIASYRKTENGAEVTYGDGFKTVYSGKTGETSVYKNGELVANDTYALVQSPDGNEKMLAAASAAGRVSGKLSGALAECEGVVLYRLTGDGRVFEGELTVQNGSVTFTAEAFTTYVIVAERDTSTEVAENLALSAKIKASSRMPQGLSADKMNLGNRIITIAKPAGVGAWSDILKNLGANMTDEKDNLKVEYPAYPQASTDGDPNTCWVPCGESKPWIEYDFTTSEAVSAVKITESANGGGKITSFKILAAGENGVYSEIYEGGKVPQTEIKFSRAVTASKLKLEITGTEGTPQIAELAIY